MSTLTGKTCRKCGKYYALSGFGNDTKAKDGKKCICKRCQSVQYMLDRKRATILLQPTSADLSHLLDFIKRYKNKYMRRLVILYDKKAKAVYVNFHKRPEEEIKKICQSCSSSLEVLVSVPISESVAHRLRSLLAPHKIHDFWYHFTKEIRLMVDNIKSCE